jgi:hypothetical protein
VKKRVLCTTILKLERSRELREVYGPKAYMFPDFSYKVLRPVCFLFFYLSAMQASYTESAPEPVGPFSQGIISGSMFYSSGQIGIDPNTLLLKE